MVPSAVAAFVGLLHTFLREVVPPLAFEASDGLALGFLNVAASVADGEAVSDSPVGKISIVERHN